MSRGGDTLRARAERLDEQAAELRRSAQGLRKLARELDENADRTAEARRVEAERAARGPGGLARAAKAANEERRATPPICL